MSNSSDAIAVGPQDAQRQLRDLQLILRVTRSMGAAMELDELLALILDSARQVLNAERTSLFLYDPGTEELVSKYAHGVGEIRFPADRGLAGAAAQGRRTINTPDAYADPRFNRDVDRTTGYRTRCLLTVPLFGLENQLVGVVQALNKIGGVFGAYDEFLAEALAAQIGVALQRARLMTHYVEKKQLEQSLAIARSIQQGLLPQSAPQIPGYDIAGFSRPADETGGDCYDFSPLPGGRWAISVADATGHGIGPALVISECRALLRAFSGSSDEAESILARTNTWLCADLTEGRFVTAFFGVLDPATHLLRHASAGHGPLFWYRAADKSVFTTGATGLPLGLFDPNEFTPADPVRFAPGDIGVFLTDGFVETADPAGELFGEKRMAELIARNAGDGAAALIGKMEAAISGFISGGRQLDDLTAVVVKRQA